MDYSPTGSSAHRILQGRTGVNYHPFLLKIFLTQGLDPGTEPRSPALQADSLPSELPEKPEVVSGGKIIAFKMQLLKPPV